MARVEVFPDRAGGYKFRIKAANDEVICQSGAYSKQDDAARGAATLIATVVEIHNHPPVKVEFL